MEFRTLGQSGLEVSVAGLGTNQLGGRLDMAESAALVHAALDLGVTLFDDADIYGGRGRSEEALGRALEGHRQEVVIATKFGNVMGDGPMQGGGSRRWIMQAVEDSLRRLQTDYIDLYYVHIPDSRTPQEETVRAMEDLVTQGKVRYIANSNYAGWQIVDAHWIARTTGGSPFVCAENQYHLLDRRAEAEIIPAVRACGMGFMPYAPLARGMLTGKYERGAPAPEGTRLSTAPQATALLVDRNFDLIERLSAFAERQGHTVHELALSWLARKPFVSCVIAGATSVEQVRANVAGTEWRLTTEEMEEADAISGA